QQNKQQFFWRALRWRVSLVSALHCRAAAEAGHSLRLCVEPKALQAKTGVWTRNLSSSAMDHRLGPWNHTILISAFAHIFSQMLR
ncbi:MAG: hypothetical protein NTX25_15965, partial [Proteobacteria bacterium]|nr:hypothetical protein [Pseudomonadota bacterium]